MNVNEIDVSLEEAKAASITTVNKIMAEFEKQIGEKMPDLMAEGLRGSMEIAFMLGAGYMRAELHSRIQSFVLAGLALHANKDMTVN